MTVEVLEPVATLEELAATANSEHGQAESALRVGLEHAIRCGEALQAARNIVDPDDWMAWIAGNFNASHMTASLYIRVASYKFELDAAEVDSINGAKAYLAGLPPANPVGRPRRLNPRKTEALKLITSGLSRRDIADHLDVSIGTVARWLDPSADARYQETKRQKKIRKREAEQALERQERDQQINRALRKVGAAHSELYAMAERMQDVLGQAHKEAAGKDAKRALSLAGEHYRKMRDEIVRSLGVA